MEREIPVINSSEIGSTDRLFLMSAGAYGDTHGFVWADSCETAFEVWVEWLDDHAPGLLVSHEEMQERATDAAAELGFESLNDALGLHSEAVYARAEADITLAGHTTLTNGVGIASHEWFMIEIDRDSDEYKQALVTSLQEQLTAGSEVQDLADALAFELKYIEDDCESIEVRLQLSADGRTELHIGDPCFDTDHKGFWGASCLTREDGDCVALAKDLIEQALEMVSQ